MEFLSWSQKRQHTLTLTSWQSMTVNSKEYSVHLESQWKCISSNFPGKNLARTSEYRVSLLSVLLEHYSQQLLPRACESPPKRGGTWPSPDSTWGRPVQMYEVKNYSQVAKSSTSTWFSLPWLASICGLCHLRAVTGQDEGGLPVRGTGGAEVRGKDRAATTRICFLSIAELLFCNCFALFRIQYLGPEN